MKFKISWIGPPQGWMLDMWDRDESGEYWRHILFSRFYWRLRLDAWLRARRVAKDKQLKGKAYEFEIGKALEDL